MELYNFHRSRKGWFATASSIPTYQGPVC